MSAGRKRRRQSKKNRSHVGRGDGAGGGGDTVEELQLWFPLGFVSLSLLSYILLRNIKYRTRM